MAEIDWTLVGPMVAQMLATYLAAEKDRTGLTAEEIFERSGRKLDSNEAKLLEDLARLHGTDND